MFTYCQPIVRRSQNQQVKLRQGLMSIVRLIASHLHLDFIVLARHLFSKYGSSLPNMEVISSSDS